MSHCQLTFSAGFELETSGHSAQCHPGRSLERPEGQKVSSVLYFFVFGENQFFLQKKQEKVKIEVKSFFRSCRNMMPEKLNYFYPCPGVVAQMMLRHHLSAT